ncbi:MAG: glycerol kinase [Pseudomonadota bacterium]|jgi:glycerol kinase
MSEKFLLALDQGTTSSRAVLFDRQGRMRHIAQQEFRQLFPQPGWVEHDPFDIWHSQWTVTRQLMREQHLAPGDIAAIGITNQRETTLLWDRKTGEPVTNAIVWQDRRTAGACDLLKQQGKAELIRQKTGLVVDAYFSATKLRWLLDQDPAIRERAERGELAFGTVDSWLIFKLSGAHLTDPSNASRTMLFNVHTLQWDDELLNLFDIPRGILPTVVPSSGIAACTDASLFGAAIPIAGIAGDQQAATFGQACFERGMVKATYGTGCFILMNTGAPVLSQNQMLTTVGWTLQRESDHTSKLTTDHLLEGSVFAAGAAVQWLRDGLGLIRNAADIEPLAASVSDTGGVVFVPAFSGLGAPHWDPYARGTMVGISRGTSAAHIARAALEGIALQNADVLQAMQADAGMPILELRVDGGASRNDLLMQFQSDILGVPVLRPQITETTALGAASLAGLAIGFWENETALAQHWQCEKRFEPGMSEDERQTRLARWKEAITRAAGWARDH